MNMRELFERKEVFSREKMPSVQSSPLNFPESKRGSERSCLSRFSWREVGSMRGAVNINTSPPTGRRAQNLSWQPALPPFETIEFNQLCGNSLPHHSVVSSSETEKRSGRR